MQQKTDSEIEQWVLREFRLAKTLSSKELCVLCRDGVVIIKGSVRSDENKSAAAEAAGRAKGVLSVVNGIDIRLARVSVKNRPTAIMVVAARKQSVLSQPQLTKELSAKAASAG